MPYVSRRGRYWNNPGRSFVANGDPKESVVHVDHITATDLIDAEDPAVGEICQAGRDLARLGFDLKDPEVIARAIEIGRAWHGVDRPSDVSDPSMNLDPPCSVVYYMRIGNRVKIGTSTSLESRLATLNPEELMVTEDGGYTLERLRHEQFKELRTHGEWFKLEDPLTGHIEMLCQIKREAS